MRTRDTFDVLTSSVAIVADAIAIFGGFILAAWVRFMSGWIPIYRGVPSALLYVYAGGLATLLFLFIFQALGLYKRPQLGIFADKIPRLVKATSWSILLFLALASLIHTNPPLSRLTVAISYPSIITLLLVERLALFLLEGHWAQRQQRRTRVMIVGLGTVAANLRHTLEKEPRLRSQVVGFLRTRDDVPDTDIPQELIKGNINNFEQFISDDNIDELVLVDSSLPHELMTQLVIACEREMVGVLIVPDMFRLLTSKVEIRNINGIPLLGVGKWPLDQLWNRILKRIEDICGAVVGLLLSAPIMLIAGIIVKLQSPGPIFYRQQRCGEHGQVFTLYKLRTMVTDAEATTGPVMTGENDHRRTTIGAFLRRHNMDEIPQFWNVLKGDMSLAGPRPERPHFVEQFKEEISRYMWRHVSKPGMTGWAQVNGLRGDTSIQERIKFDLYYLENWSLALDFKIIVRTFFTYENAY